MTSVQQITITEKMDQSLDFGFVRAHYNIYPWIEEDPYLVRVFRLPPRRVIVGRIGERHGRTSRSLVVQLFAKRGLGRAQLARVRERLVFALGLDDDYRRVRRAARGDRVLSTALRVNRGIRPKRYPTLVTLPASWVMVFARARQA